MKTFTVPVYDFDELEKRIQDSILDFNMRTRYPLEIISQMIANKKIRKKIVAKEKRQCKRLWYLKNGDIYCSKEEPKI